MLETRQNFENRLCSRNAMYKRDIKVWVWNSAMYGCVHSEFHTHSLSLGPQGICFTD
jgi:hypothetical protein